MPFGRPGKPGKIERAIHLGLPTSVQRRSVFLPLLLINNPYHLPTLNLHTRPSIHTRRRGNRSHTSTIPSRMLRQACRVVQFRHNRR